MLPNSSGTGTVTADVRAYNSSGAQQYEQVTTNANTTTSSPRVWAQISGTGDIANLKNADVWYAENTVATVRGDWNTVYPGFNDAVDIYGNYNYVYFPYGDWVRLSGLYNNVGYAYWDTVILENSSVATISGNLITAYAGWNDSLDMYGNNNTANYNSGDWLRTNGSHNSVSGGIGMVFLSGSDIDAYVDATVNVANNTDAYIEGRPDMVNLGSNDTVHIWSNSGIYAITSVNAPYSGDNITLTGYFDNVNVTAPGSTINLNAASLLGGLDADSSRINLAYGSYLLLNNGADSNMVTGVTDSDIIHNFGQENVFDISNSSLSLYGSGSGSSGAVVGVNNSFLSYSVTWEGEVYDPITGWDLGWGDFFICSSYDPIVLNLWGDPVETVALESANVHFDVNNNGQKVRTGWLTGGEAMLVYDPTDSNVVTKHADLVGSFNELKKMDSNDDRVLNSSDADWKNLKLWIYQNGTGEFVPESLYTLDKLDIASINLAPVHVNKDDHGNKILDESTFAWTNGKTGHIAAVDFAFDPDAVQGRTKTRGAFDPAQSADIARFREHSFFVTHCRAAGGAVQASLASSFQRRAL